MRLYVDDWMDGERRKECEVSVAADVSGQTQFSDAALEAAPHTPVIDKISSQAANDVAPEAAKIDKMQQCIRMSVPEV